jgi:haloalkane dehalogenase
MENLRTPDERFDNLPGYSFEPRYAEIGGLRVHYLDEGPADGTVVLMLHGEPSWCYLYRKMIPVLTAAGFRAVAPDLVGFGRSDKPTRREDYTYARHVEWMRALICDHLDLAGITLVCQDWGGLLGMRLAAEHPERFERIVAANTGLPTGDQPAGPDFLAWRDYSQKVPEFPAGGILQRATVSDLPDEVIAAYDAPFPDESYKAGARQFPMLVPISPYDPAAPANRAAWGVLSRWTKPFLTAFADSDPIFAGLDAPLQRMIPGATGQPHTIIESAGHFLQEDQGERLAEVVVDFIGRTPGA